MCDFRCFRLQGTVIGLDVDQLARFRNVNGYFVGSGEYIDGARSANTLREAALILSIVGFFITAVSLIFAALVAACKKNLKILSVTLVYENENSLVFLF